MIKSLIVAGAFAVLSVGCAGASSGGAPGTVPVAGDALVAHQFPPVCTAPAPKSGKRETAMTAFGSIVDGSFSLQQPSSWLQVTWYSAPPPGARRALPPQVPHAKTPYDVYWGNYRVSDGTQGCIYIVVPAAAKTMSAVTAQPHIPGSGATIPDDFGQVGTLTIDLKKSSGAFVLVHDDGSKAFTGTLSIRGHFQKTN
ncbi:MAG TPA: hypothetical protein VMF61_01990 [Candidatus Acidoferrales bacterium]|nr:hypothetical protein [Candidatus Acidoferrales bacterium]